MSVFLPSDSISHSSTSKAVCTGLSRKTQNSLITVDYVFISVFKHKGNDYFYLGLIKVIYF